MALNTMEKKHLDANKKLWNEYAKAHYNSVDDEYNVNEFLAGKTTLRPFEIKEVGDVKGKTLLHLQCHFGLDTLSWVREGAIATGVDFSDDAMKFAPMLAERAGLKANFVQTDIYKLKDNLDGKFDIVYTSIGVLCWLNDMEKWAEIIAHFLKPGGMFYIAEIHPFSMVFDEEHEKELTIKYDYFHDPEPLEFETDRTYAVEKPEFGVLKEYEWNHSVSDIVNALIKAGLEIQFFNEYPFTCWKSYPFAEKDPDGYWRLKNQKADIPLLFSIKAIKK